MQFRLFDTVIILTNEMTNRIAPEWKESPTRKHLLQTCCAQLDILSDILQPSEVNVTIDEDLFTIWFTLECTKPDPIGAAPYHPSYTKMIRCFEELTNRARELRVIPSALGDRNMSLCFIFPGIWVNKLVV